ncbi:MAG: HK97 family phage prohead protease [Rickettsia sp.]|nr:HK97 family phage prohead protease [Rickettsia sp.]
MTLVNSNFFKSINNHYIISGYASKFNILDKQKEIVRENAFIFNEVSQIKLLWQHDYSKPIGFIENLSQDHIGLFINARIILDTQIGKETIALVSKNVVNGLSVGFEIIDQKFDNLGQKNILKANLLEISIVTFPANAEAIITSIDDYSSFSLNHSLSNLGKMLENFS